MYTEYQELDKRVTLTKEKKEELLPTRGFPEIPIPNNPAELALREPVVKRKISNGTRSEDEKTISFFDYIPDIFWKICYDKIGSSYFSKGISKIHLLLSRYKDCIKERGKNRRELYFIYNKKISKTFEDITGVGGVLNASFNLHGYPIVGTPEMALWTFENLGLDGLVMGNWLVRK